MINITYSIVRNATNKVVYITDNYDNYINYVIKHFPKTSMEADKISIPNSSTNINH